MIKKKAKSKMTTKKTAEKRSSNKGTSKGQIDLNPAEVPKDIYQMVESEAATMAQAVIAEGKKGQLATVKYLFEVAKIFPEATDGGHSTLDEDCLARNLLKRLDVPDEPIARDEEDEPKAATSANKPTAKAGEDEGKDPGSELEESKEPVPV